MSALDRPAAGLVRDYLELGLRLGRHVDGLVDAYYGPGDLAANVAAEPVLPPQKLVADARALIAALESGSGAAGLAAGRRRWLRAQTVGLLTTARVLAGEQISYSDEVEACYGVRPRRVSEDELAAAHKVMAEALPGSGPLAERVSAWREAQAVPACKLEAAIRSLHDDLRERTYKSFGLPEGERVDFELVTGKPWSGFNYYLGGLRSRVALNVDLPVLSPSLAHLVAHEAYPGHHTEHSRKEAGLVRRRDQLEETIFLVGTPQCLISEGLADLGLEVLLGTAHERVVEGHLMPLGIPYDANVVRMVAAAGETLSAARSNAALALHEDGEDPAKVVDDLARWALLSRPRAEKAVSFLLDRTWRAYITCYVEGLRLCRAFVGATSPAGQPLERFARLITEQLLPADLEAA